MTLRAWRVGAAAIVFAAGCSKAPKQMSDAERTALADSVIQLATQMMASFQAPATAASVDKWFGYFVGGNELVHAEYGMVYPTYDSLVKMARAVIFRPGTSFKLTLDQQRVTVLDRDVVVLTALLNGVFKDSAGKETPDHEAWTAVYHRTPDGWKIAADHASIAPPAPPVPAKPARRTR